MLDILRLLATDYFWARNALARSCRALSAPVDVNKFIKPVQYKLGCVHELPNGLRHGPAFSKRGDITYKFGVVDTITTDSSRPGHFKISVMWVHNNSLYQLFTVGATEQCSGLRVAWCDDASNCLEAVVSNDMVLWLRKGHMRRMLNTAITPADIASRDAAQAWFDRIVSAKPRPPCESLMHKKLSYVFATFEGRTDPFGQKIDSS